MGAVIVAHTACKGADSAVSLVKGFVENRRAAGDSRGEVAMMHRWACMAKYPDVAMSTAQAALELATSIGDAAQEVALKNTITDLWVARGKPEKAPTRKQALRLLRELAGMLEKKDKEKFDDALRRLGPHFKAI